jgi:SAM-dependent methyltransferase
MSDQYLDLIRTAELRLVLPYFSEVQAASSPTRVLEIGAGTGLQARLLTEAGFEVSAIDLPRSSYAATREFPVVDYDGNTLPFPPADFRMAAVVDRDVLSMAAAARAGNRRRSTAAAKAGRR